MGTIRELWDNALSKYADITAVRWLEKKEIKERSYKELGNNIAAIRKGLQAERFVGAHISLIGTSSVEWIGSYLGITTGQNVAVPLDAGLPSEDLIDLLNDADAQALFLSPKRKDLAEQVRSQCPKVQKIWLLQETAEEGFATLADLKAAGADTADVAGRKVDEIVTLIYTSGTTGKSKGVMLTQNNLCENAASISFTAEPGTAVLSVLPIHHAFCLVMDWLKGFSLGATLCINDSFMHMVRNMSIFKPEIMLMVPLMIETIYKKLAARIGCHNISGFKASVVFGHRYDLCTELMSRDPWISGKRLIAYVTGHISTAYTAVHYLKKRLSFPGLGHIRFAHMYLKRFIYHYCFHILISPFFMICTIPCFFLLNTVPSGSCGLHIHILRIPYHSRFHRRTF